MIQAATDFLRKSTLARYVLVGGTGFAIELLVLFQSTVVFGLSNLVAVTLSFWIGIVASFFLQKTVAFGSSGMGFSTLSLQAAMYALLVLVNYAFSLVLAELLAGIIGIYLARALALLITTVWNFAAYKWIIFNERLNGHMSDRFETVLHRVVAALTTSATPLALVFAAVLSAPLLMLAAMAGPVADDYLYFAHIEQAGSPWAFAVDHFNTQNGRFTQALTVGVGHALFGADSVIVVPAILFIAMVIVLAWNLRQLIPFSTQPWLSSFALSGSLTATALFMMPSFFDTYLWLTSSTVYLGSIIMMLLGTGLTMTLIRRPSTRAVLVPLTMVVLLVGQTFSEPTSVFAIGLWGLLLIGMLITRDWKLAGISALLWISLIAGFLISYFSPGTQIRREVVGESLSLPTAVYESLNHYRTLAATISPWMVLLLLAAILLAAANINAAQLTLRASLWAAGIVAVLGIGSTLGVFFVSEVGSTYYPWRNYTLPVYGAVVFGALFILYLVGPIRAKFASSTVPAAAVLASLLCAVIALPALFGFLAQQGAAVALRASAIEQRNVSVAEQLALGATTIRVEAAPVLVRSEAYDILNPHETQVEWIVTPYRALAGIPDSATLEFVQTPDSYCLPASARVKPEFTC